MKQGKPVLLFVSPVFLFPNDAGGKIRSTHVLRGLKGGRFHVVLISPVPEGQDAQWSPEIDSVCDEFVGWPAAATRARWMRSIDLLGRLPVNVRADLSEDGMRCVHEQCTRSDVDLIVFDFVHSAVLRPHGLKVPTLCFTHNMEAEIFARHAQSASNPIMRWVWASQQRKMVSFERRELSAMNTVIAVSRRDAIQMEDRYGLRGVRTIPTGVDLQYFAWNPPSDPPVDGPSTVVFTGSMDWEANRIGVEWFVHRVWPLVLKRIQNTRFVVVGKNPPAWLKAVAQRDASVHCTGFVDDIRPHAQEAQVFVIPLQVGGGTRIKAFEAMAMGVPVVSTAVGIEGLEVAAGTHYLEADAPQDMADAITRLLQDGQLRRSLSRAARAEVEARFGHLEVARVFEDICLRTWGEATPVLPPIPSNQWVAES